MFRPADLQTSVPKSFRVLNCIDRARVLKRHLPFVLVELGLDADSPDYLPEHLQCFIEAYDKGPKYDEGRDFTAMPYEDFQRELHALYEDAITKFADVPLCLEHLEYVVMKFDAILQRHSVIRKQPPSTDDPF